MKELKQDVARAENKLHRREQQRKPQKKRNGSGKNLERK